MAAFIRTPEFDAWLKGLRDPIGKDGNLAIGSTTADAVRRPASSSAEATSHRSAVTSGLRNTFSVDWRAHHEQDSGL
ncbi:MAG: hypothetical protein U0974_06130 [Gemmatimonadales bacterium]|nr:hypothetical protein [Gemmatimonadales bacterium]MDZ4389289.1 hypothetical protein [Gemmatimonadales bacterium]